METKSPTSRQAARGFAAATASLLAVFAAGALPVPLYATYRQTVGLTDADVNATMFLYLAGIMATLLFAGRLSDSVGRKPVAFLSLAGGVVGCVLFALAQAPAAVLFARVVQGASCGLAMSAVSSLAVECSAAAGRVSWGLVVASCGCSVGVTAGSLGCGFLAGVLPNIEAVYWTMAGVLLVLAFAVAFAPETSDGQLTLASAVKPRLFVPKRAKRAFLAACAAYVSVWGVSGFFQAYSALISTDVFQSQGPLLASIVLACTMATSPIGGPACARFSTRRALPASMAIVLASCLLMAVCLVLCSVPAFLAACTLFSLASGACLSGSLRALLDETPAADTSAAISAVNFVGYLGCTLVSCGAGTLVGSLSFPVIFFALAAQAALATSFVVASSVRQTNAIRAAHGA